MLGQPLQELMSLANLGFVKSLFMNEDFARACSLGLSFESGEVVCVILAYFLLYLAIVYVVVFMPWVFRALGLVRVVILRASLENIVTMWLE
mgnify:FL=1